MPYDRPLDLAEHCLDLLADHVLGDLVRLHALWQPRDDDYVMALSRCTISADWVTASSCSSSLRCTLLRQRSSPLT